jgi:hypothetical protein
MNILDLVVGKPIRTLDERAEQIGPAQGIPIFGLDGLSSAAYGPEAALSLLIPLGLLGVRYIVPVSAAIITLLVIVYFSYRQTIAAYPSGGGSYTVARFNLAARLSPEVIAVHVDPGEHSELLQDDWKNYVEQPFRDAGKEPPQLHILPSPYRFIVIPVVQFILDLAKKHPDRSVVVVIPELVEDRWYEFFLHNQRGRLLQWALLARGNERIFTVRAPWYVRGRT